MLHLKIRRIALVCLFSGWFPAVAQEVDETQEVLVIDVPVQVMRGGGPLRGLTADNFQVFDNGESQTITNFEMVDLDDLSTADDQLVRPTIHKQRHFVFFFDMFFSSPPKTRKVLSAAQDMLLDLALNDKVAVVVFTPNKGITMLSGFTNDELQTGAALDAVDWFSDPRNYEAMTRDANRESESHAKSDPYWYEEKLYLDSEPQVGLKLETRLDLAYEKMGDRLVGDERSAQLKELLDGLNKQKNIGTPRPMSSAAMTMAADLAFLANALKDLEGGKYLVLFSEGFSNEMLLRENFADMIQVQLENMVDVFRKTEWAIHTVDTRGLRHLGAAPNQDSLNQMAKDTGGHFYRNYNSMDKALRDVTENTAVTYILSYQPKEVVLDGSYHELRVELKGVPNKARIQYSRPGYYAPFTLKR